jgi:hypothetical protein
VVTRSSQVVALMSVVGGWRSSMLVFQVNTGQWWPARLTFVHAHDNEMKSDLLSQTPLAVCAFTWTTAHCAITRVGSHPPSGGHAGTNRRTAILWTKSSCCGRNATDPTAPTVTPPTDAHSAARKKTKASSAQIPPLRTPCSRSTDLRPPARVKQWRQLLSRYILVPPHEVVEP